MFVAFHIWLKLRNSIPLKYRSYYSLLPDPAVGNVKVVARTAALEEPGLWSTKADNAGSNHALRSKWITGRPTLAVHLAFIPVSPALPVFATVNGDAGKTESIPTFCRFNISRKAFLGRTWMTVVDRCGFTLTSNETDDWVYRRIGLEDEDPDEVRFAVQGDMRASEPTPLRMSWAQFVWLSLALGVRPDDPAWHLAYPCTLKDSGGNALITLFESDGQILARLWTGRDVTYSLHRAFAWRNILLENGGLWPLGWQGSSHVPLRLVQMSPDLSFLRAAEDLTCAKGDVLRGKEAQECDDPLASACRWMLYARLHQDKTGELLPISQRMLEYRQRRLYYLKLLDERGELEARVCSLVRTPSELRVTVAVNEENTSKHDHQEEVRADTVTRDEDKNSDDEANVRVPQDPQQHILDKRRDSTPERLSVKGQSFGKQDLMPHHENDGVTKHHESATSNLPKGSVDSVSAQVEGINGQVQSLQPPRPSTNRLSTEAIAEAPSNTSIHNGRSSKQPRTSKTPAKPNTQLTVSELKTKSIIVDAIRSAVAGSSYVRLCAMLISLAAPMIRDYDRTSRFRKKLFHAMEAEALRDIQKPLREFCRDWSELKTLTADNAQKIKQPKVYELIPLVHREGFEKAVLKRSSTSSEALGGKDEDIEFMASVALALADWDATIHQAWQLNVEATPLLRSLISPTSVLTESSRSADHLQSFGTDKLELEVQFLDLRLVERGLYNAPRDTSLDALLTKGLRTISLL